MAKLTKQKSIEETLWESANKLRGSVESAEYKHVVLGLIFLKFASDKFEEHRKKLLREGKEKYIEMPDFYNRCSPGGRNRLAYTGTNGYTVWQGQKHHNRTHNQCV